MPRELGKIGKKATDAGAGQKRDTGQGRKERVRERKDLMQRHENSGQEGERSVLQRLKDRLGNKEQSKVEALGRDDWGPRYTGSTRDIEDMLLKKVGATRDNVYGYSSNKEYTLPDGRIAQERSISYHYVFRDGNNNVGTMQGVERYTRIADAATILNERGVAREQLDLLVEKHTKGD